MMASEPLPAPPRRPRQSPAPAARPVVPIRPRGDKLPPAEATLDAWSRQEEERIAGHLRRLSKSRRGLMPFGPDGPLCVEDHGWFSVSWRGPVGPVLDADRTASASIEFDFVSTDRKTGEVVAEVTAYYDDPLDLLARQRAHLTLTSIDRRDRFAKQLADRTPSLKLDWRRMLDQACEWVAAYHRGGDPAILLREAPEPLTESTSLLPPITAGEGATILFGDGGTGKSYLALALGIQLHTGRSDLFPGVVPMERRHVALLDWEWTGWVHKRRMRRLLGSTDDADMPDMTYISCQLPLRDERDRLRRIIRDRGVEFLIVDSVGLAAGSEPEAADTAIQFMASLRELGLPALLIAHVTKADAKGAADRPFGSTFWHNSARSTWYAKRGDDVLDDGFTVGLFHRKANDAPLAPPIGVRVRFSDTRTALEPVAVREVDNLESERPLKYRVRDTLIAGPRTVREIADELDAELDNVRRTLNRDRLSLFVQLDGFDDRVQRWALAARKDQDDPRTGGPA